MSKNHITLAVLAAVVPLAGCGGGGATIGNGPALIAPAPGPPAAGTASSAPTATASSAPGGSASSAPTGSASAPAGAASPVAGMPSTVPSGAATVAPTSAPIVTTQALPCDIYASAGTPCVAAHSSTRKLSSRYDGPLYRVSRASDGTTRDVGTLTDGYADSAAQDAFCSGTVCTITKVYDQSSYGNDLAVAGPGGNAPTADAPVVADALPITAGGRKVYGMYFGTKTGYRLDQTVGIATGGEPESMYMVASGTHTNNGCCFDYGNAETNGEDTGNGHMDAVYLGSLQDMKWPIYYGGGPWIQADLENGLFMSNQGYSMDNAYTGSTTPFVTAMLKNDGMSSFALHVADGQSGPLTTVWASSLPSSPLNPNPPSQGFPQTNNPTHTAVENPPLSGYEPMRKEGGIILGIGGDGSNSAVGSFFEGVMTRGVSSDAADAAVQANIVGVHYR